MAHLPDSSLPHSVATLTFGLSWRASAGQEGNAVKSIKLVVPFLLWALSLDGRVTRGRCLQL